MSSMHLLRTARSLLNITLVGSSILKPSITSSISSLARLQQISVHNTCSTSEKGQLFGQGIAAQHRSLHSQARSKVVHTGPSSQLTMSTSSSPDPVIAEILDYWFSMDAKGWFMESEKNDATITSRFSHLVEKARLTSELDSTWTQTPSGTLALILLLDQFTRNIYRPGNHAEPGLSWSGDAKALEISAQAIAKGFDRAIQEENASSPTMGFPQRSFIYMPFMHAENFHDQIASCALFDNLKHEFELIMMEKRNAGKEDTEAEKGLEKQMEAGVGMAVRHRDCVSQLGRFPKRNDHLNRETTEAEKEFLEKNPAGF